MIKPTPEQLKLLTTTTVHGHLCTKFDLTLDTGELIAFNKTAPCPMHGRQITG